MELLERIHFSVWVSTAAPAFKLNKIIVPTVNSHNKQFINNNNHSFHYPQKLDHNNALNKRYRVRSARNSAVHVTLLTPGRAQH